jgi:ankyrin repeat protein
VIICVTLTGFCPIHIAAQLGYSEIFDLLVCRIQETDDFRNAELQTPLHLAVTGGKKKERRKDGQERKKQK